MLQQRVSRATVADLIAANQLVGKIRDFSHVKITFRSIPIQDAVLVVSTDASWSNTETLGSQAGFVTLFANKKITKNEWADVSPLRWKTYKMERKTQSTLGAELMSAARGIAECNWLRSLFAEACCMDYCLEQDQSFRNMLEMVLVVDNKPIYDHIHGEGVIVKDKRMAIDMLLVRKDLHAAGSTVRWVDTRQMLSDALTKSSASPEFLLFVIRFGKYVLVRETDSLNWRAKEREERMKNRSQKRTSVCSSRGYVKTCTPS